MDYLRSLTIRQWLIVFCVITFFIIVYFMFSNKKSPTDQMAEDLNILMRQGQATVPIDENLTKSEINALMRQGVAATSSAQRNPKQIEADRVRQEDEKEALSRLMSGTSSK